MTFVHYSITDTTAPNDGNVSENQGVAALENLLALGEKGNDNIMDRFNVTENVGDIDLPKLSIDDAVITSTEDGFTMSWEGTDVSIDASTISAPDGFSVTFADGSTGAVSLGAQSAAAQKPIDDSFADTFSFEVAEGSADTLAQNFDSIEQLMQLFSVDVVEGAGTAATSGSADIDMLMQFVSIEDMFDGFI